MGKLTKAQWDVFGRLEAAGLVTRCVFIARITPAARSALEDGREA